MYWILKPIVRLILLIFFKRVEVQGLENLPAKGPIILAGNHPNMLLDPLLLAAYTKRKVHYLAKSTLFKNPLVALLLRSCGVIPLYRQRDNPAEMEKNQSSFAAAHKILEKGRSLGIFPEGTSHAEPHLMSIKTGISRIALETEEKNNFSLGIQIVPVGLNFRNRESFRSRVLVVYGKPFSVAQYAESYKQDPQQTVRDLTAKVEKLIKDITLNINTSEDARFIEKIETIYRKEFLTHSMEVKEENRLLTNLTFNQILVDGYQHFNKNKPETIKMLKGEIESYLTMIEKFGLHPDVVGFQIGKIKAFFYLLWHFLFFLLGFPLALYGILNNYLPYRIPRWVSHAMTSFLEEFATFKLLTGMVTFPLFYALQTGWVGYHFGWMYGLEYLLSLPLAGFFALIYMDTNFRFFRSSSIYLRFIAHRDLKDQLEKKKNFILSELQKLTDEYMALRSKS